MKTLTRSQIPPSRLKLYALPPVPGIEKPGARPPGPAGRVAEYEFRELIERLAEVCWEATRAHLRSEFDSVAAIDLRVPRKWLHADEGERQRVRAQVLTWWNGGEELARVPAITHVCRAIVLEYQRQFSEQVH